LDIELELISLEDEISHRTVQSAKLPFEFENTKKMVEEEIRKLLINFFIDNVEHNVTIENHYVTLYSLEHGDEINIKEYTTMSHYIVWNMGMRSILKSIPL
jgi:hypothetical protein